MPIQINRITNANVYLNGRSFLGQAESVELPQVKVKMAEHKGLGMVGHLEFPAGLEKFDCKISWNSFYPNAQVAVANPFRTVPVMVRGSLEQYTGAGRVGQVPVVANLTAAFRSLPLGNFKKSDNVELTTEAAVYYVRQTIDGRDIVEIDVLANIWRVDGVDLLADYRVHLGI